LKAFTEKRTSKIPPNAAFIPANRRHGRDRHHQLIEDTKSEIVINLGQAYVNMSVLEACMNARVTYMDTAIHEDPTKVCEDPPWYATTNGNGGTDARKKGVNAILGVGFDPGVVNAWCALAVKHHFDSIDTIDILDVNAGKPREIFRHQLRSGN
jgi:saccharopine dehydrogenase-like NADP-dependent oxidoreductase